MARLLPGLILVGVVLQGPAWAQTQSSDPALAAGAWRVVEIEGAQAAHRETLQFTGQGIACQSACNRFSAGFKQQGQAVEQVVWTLGSSPSAGKCDHDNPIPRE